MRAVTFIFALSFLTTLGWKVHSTLFSWSTPVIVSISPIQKLVSISTSQNINQKEVDDVSKSESFTYFASIEKKLTARKISKNKIILRKELLSVEKFKSEKGNFSLPIDPYENIVYKINYKDVSYNYIAFVFEPKLNENQKNEIAESNNEDKVVEQVVTTKAAKSQEMKTDDKEIDLDDVEIFDYSAKNDKINPLMNTQNSSVSKNVDTVIRREIQRDLNVSTENHKEKTDSKVIVGSIEPDQVKIKTQKQQTFNMSFDSPATSLQLATKSHEAIAMNNPIKTDENKSINQSPMSTQEIIVKAEKVDFSGTEMSIHRFELIPFDDENEINSSDSEGMAKLSMKEGQNRLVSLRAEGLLSTNFKLSTVNDDNAVPMLSQEALGNLLDRYKVTGEGAYLVVQLDKEIKDVVLDKTFEAKIYLDENFKIVSANKNPQFVMFIGILPGNTMIGYDFYNNKKINEIVYLAESEVYFANEEFKTKTDFDFSLYSKELMGQGRTPLNVTGDMIVSFNDNQESKKATLNSYEFKDIISVKNDANYFELRLNDHNIFFAANDRSEVELPSKTYFNEILSQFNLNNLKESCVVQLNFNEKNKIDELKFNGRSHQGFENLDLIALDNDGSLGADVSDTTKKVFLSGNAQGVINIKLKYTNGNTDYLQTYCSPGIYLVEQF